MRQIAALCEIAMEYERLEIEYQELMEAKGYQIYKNSTNSKYPKTAKALVHFNAKMEAIKSGLYSCIESENPYSFRILFRCLCEHYLKFMYCLVRNTKEKNDQVGIEFYEYCGADEMLGYVKAMEMAFELQGYPGALETKNVLKRLYPKASGMSKNALSSESHKFKYRSIIRYFAQEASEWFSEPSSFMIQVVPIYAELSAFVHGGPSADFQMREFSEQKSLDETRRKGPLVFSMVASATRYSAIFFREDFEEANQLQIDLNGLIQRSGAFVDEKKST
jgi:hypothetical protein